MCKHGDMFSRGLFLLFLFSPFYFSFQLPFAGVYSVEVPPVPFPNTAVKLFRVDDTWTVASWKIISMPAYFGPLAQLVRATGS